VILHHLPQSAAGSRGGDATGGESRALLNFNARHHDPRRRLLHPALGHLDAPLCRREAIVTPLAL